MRKNKLKKSVAVTLAAVTIAGALPSNIALASGFNHNNFETELQEKIEFLQSIAHYEFLKVSEITNYYIDLAFETGDWDIIPDSTILIGRANYYILNNPSFNIIGGLSELYNLISVIPDHSVNATIRDELEDFFYRASLPYTNTKILTLSGLILYLQGLDHNLINSGLEARKAVRSYIEKALVQAQLAANSRFFWHSSNPTLSQTFTHMGYLEGILDYINFYSIELHVGGVYPNLYYFEVKGPIHDILANSVNPVARDIVLNSNDILNSSTDMVSDYFVVFTALRTFLQDLMNAGYVGLVTRVWDSDVRNLVPITGTNTILTRVNEFLVALQYIENSVLYVEQGLMEVLGFIPVYATLDSVDLSYLFYFEYDSEFFEHLMHLGAVQRFSETNEARLMYLHIILFYLEAFVEYGMNSFEAWEHASYLFYSSLFPIVP